MNGKTNATQEINIGALIPLEPPTDVTTKSLDKKAEITWTDPVDKYATPGGESVAEWMKSVLVRKVDSEPISVNDGTIILQTTIRDQYQSSPYTDENLVNGTNYYYRAFAYSNYEVISNGSLSNIATPRNAYPVNLGNSKDDVIAELPDVDFYYSNAMYTAEGINKGIIICTSQSVASNNYLYAYDKNLVQTSSRGNMGTAYSNLNVGHLDNVGLVSIGGGGGSTYGNKVYAINDDLVVSSPTEYPKDINRGIIESFNGHIMLVEPNDSNKSVNGYDENFVFTTVANLPYLFCGNIYGNNGRVTSGNGTASANDQWMVIGGVINNYSILDTLWEAYTVALSPDYVQTDLGKCEVPFAAATGISTTKYNILSYGITSQWMGNNQAGAVVYDQNLIYSHIDLDMADGQDRIGGSVNNHSHGVLTGGFYTSGTSTHAGDCYDVLMIDNNLVQSDMGSVRDSTYSCNGVNLVTYDKYAIAITIHGHSTTNTLFAVE